MTKIDTGSKFNMATAAILKTQIAIKIIAPSSKRPVSRRVTSTRDIRNYYYAVETSIDMWAC